MQDVTVVETEPVTAELVVETGAERRRLSITVYTPLTRGGSVTRQQDRIRLSNQARAAMDILISHGARAGHARRLVAPLLAVSERAADRAVSLPHALVTFIADDGVQFLGVDSPVEEAVITGPRFYTRPLLNLLGNPRRAYVLTASQGRARLWQVSGDEVTELDVPQMPPSMQALAQFEDREASLQSHSTGLGERGFHGHGEVEERANEHLLEQYVRSVATAVGAHLGSRRGLFVLAGPEEVTSVYRQVAGEAPRSVDYVVNGNFDRAPVAEIRDMAGGAIEEDRRRRTAQVDRRLAELTAPAAGEALTDIAEIVHAAYQGRLSELLIAPELRATGVFDPDTGRLSPCAGTDSPECEDLVDLAAVLTLRYGGDVHIAGPSENRKQAQMVCAILRG